MSEGKTKTLGPPNISVTPQQIAGAAVGAAQAGPAIVRVGPEDSQWAEKAGLAASYAEQVTIALRMFEDLGCEVATPAGAREILILKGEHDVKS